MLLTHPKTLILKSKIFVFVVIISMRDKISISENKTQGQEIWCACENCSVETQHIVMQSVELDGRALDWEYDYNESYQIIKCQGCGSISFRKVHTNSENTDYDTDQGWYALENIDIYPRRFSGRKILNNVSLPFHVKCIYEETYSAFCNHQLRLFCLGMRALIEEVCRDRNFGGSNLKEKIDKLHEAQRLTHSGATILHKLRQLGNTAAHESFIPDLGIIKKAMDVVEHLLNDIYILPEIALDLSKKANHGGPKMRS